MNNIETIFVLFILVVLSAFFSATETAYNSLSIAKIKALAENNKKARMVLKLSDDYNKLLSTVLVGNNIVNIALASISTVFFINFFENSGATISTVVTTIVVLIFGEITPKSLAKESPEKFALFAAPLINFLELVFSPLNYLFALWKKLLSKAVSNDDRSMTEEEFINIVDEAEMNGEIGEQESELIKSALELNEQNAADIATPRVDISAIPVSSSREEADAIFSDTRYSRLPVYDETIDNIVGVVHQIDFYREKDKNISDLYKKSLFVPKTIKIGLLLRKMQKEKCHMAVVTDEYGGTYGIVTMEDILEELVGEIWDEHDEIEVDYQKGENGLYSVSGSADPEEIFDILGINKEIKFATVSGWVMDELDKIPEINDSFESDGFLITVTSIDGMRVETINIEQIEKKDI